MELLVATLAFMGLIPLGLVLYWEIVGEYRRAREEAFRRTLKARGYSGREVDRAVEGQGW